MFKFIVKYLKLIDRLIYTTAEEFTSIRVKLIALMAIFVFFALQTKDPTIVSVAIGTFSTILGFYFYTRQRSQEQDPAGYKKSTYDIATSSEKRIESEDSNTPN